MRFLFLTYPEVEGVSICWHENALKSPELVSAALAAGFSESEVWSSPLGVLEEELVLGIDCVCRVGAHALLGMNGSTLVELP